MPHAGFRSPVKCSTLADANESRDWRLSLSEWTSFLSTKAAIKLHTLRQGGAFIVTRAGSPMAARRVYSTPTERGAGVICARLAVPGLAVRA